VTINVLSLGGLALGSACWWTMRSSWPMRPAEARRREMSLRRGDDRGNEEVAGPLFAGTLTTLLVFGPIIFVQGLAAALFRDLSLSVVMSVGASLMLALTLMPVMIIGRRKLVAQHERRRANPGGRAETPEAHRGLR
jgi:hydrophobic/amphiphilic exporter-1 (mainly G- bacteria), HAE1 family